MMKTYTFGETILHIADNGKFYVCPRIRILILCLRDVPILRLRSAESVS